MRSFAMPGTLAPPAAVVVRRVRLPTRPKLRGEPTAPLDTGGVDAVGSRPMRKMSLTGRTVCVVAALLAGLSAPPVALAQTPAGWQRTDMRPMTQPALAGGLFVMYARGTAGLQVSAVDPATGRTAWSQPASPSEVTQGQGPVLTVAGAEIVFLGRDAGTRPAQRRRRAHRRDPLAVGAGLVHDLAGHLRRRRDRHLRQLRVADGHQRRRAALRPRDRAGPSVPADPRGRDPRARGRADRPGRARPRAARRGRGLGDRLGPPRRPDLLAPGDERHRLELRALRRARAVCGNARS